MKFLLISAHFPPYAPAAATRAPKLAQYWLSKGHQVRVLGTYRPKFPPVLQAGIPEELITYAPMRDVNDWPSDMKAKLTGLFGGGEKASKAGEGGASRPKPHVVEEAEPSKLRACFDWWYKQLTNYPDQHVGWVDYAVAAGRKLIAAERPDLIYVTAPPHSAFLVGAKLSQEFGIPWIAEYRDAWVTNGYYDGAWFRKPFEDRLERRLMASASAIVALTEGTARTLGAHHGKPSEVAMNGFDPADFPAGKPEPLDAAKLTILYAGSIYVGKRDPSVLFEAIGQLGDRQNDVRVHFYMDHGGNVSALAEKYGVTGQIVVRPPVPHKEILKIERQADALLLLRWDNPLEDGVIAGKLFEYIGAKRPILSIGSVTGEAADIIRREKLGLVSKDPAEVAAQLKAWLAAKKQTPRLEDLGAADLDAYSRERQFDRLQAFIDGLGLK